MLAPGHEPQAVISLEVGAAECRRRHNTIAAGDAENDLALLHAAEAGAAVASTVPSLAA